MEEETLAQRSNNVFLCVIPENCLIINFFYPPALKIAFIKGKIWF